MFLSELKSPNRGTFCQSKQAVQGDEVFTVVWLLNVQLILSKRARVKYVDCAAVEFELGRAVGKGVGR